MAKAALRGRDLVAVPLRPDPDAPVVTESPASCFAEAVAPHLGVVAATAQRFASAGDWEDAAQEGLLAAWRHLDGYDPQRGTFRAWLVTIVLNEARRTHRRRAAHDRKVSALVRDLTERTASSGPGSVRLDAVEDAVARLPKRQRQVVVLHYFVDLAVDEVAQVLGLAPGTVKSTLFDARSRLRAALQTAEETHGR
jgi:RNA polymerase sigma factor (sigma-70 family)